MWVALALVCALSLATGDALTKKVLGGRGQYEYYVGWLRLVFTLPLLVVVLALVEVPHLDSTFYKAFAAAMPLEVLAFILYIKALRASPLSLTIPFLAITPVFLAGFSYVIVGEKPSLWGIAGIALVSAGGYMLNLHQAGRSLLAPLRAVARERGSMMMLAVALIFSVTSSLGKVCINHSSPLFFGSTYFIVLAVVYTPFAYDEIRRVGITRRDVAIMAAAGLLNAVMVVTHMLAMSMTKVAYMIAVKRTSLLFSVLFGWLLFGEERMRQRSAGAVLMLLGFMLLVLTAS